MLWIATSHAIRQPELRLAHAANDPRHQSPWVSLKARPEPDPGQRVRVYRNLNNGQYSVVALDGPHKGLVLGYAPAIGLSDVNCRVSLKTRDRVIKQGVRTVHAWSDGRYEGCSDQPPIAFTSSSRRVTYFPFVKPYFFQRTAPDKPVTEVRSAWAYKADLWVSESPSSQ